MILNDAGRALIMEFESLQLTAYKCPAGVTTIGYGHTGDVEMGNVITRHQAEVILEHDLCRFEAAVERLCPKANSNQFSSMVSLTFNIGVAAFERSTLRRVFNQGNVRVAAQEFMRWQLAAGKVLPGLVRRRAAERALFLTVPS